VKEIGGNVFSGSGLTSLDIGMEVISEYAFAGTSLKFIKIQSSVKTIGRCAFWDCKALKSISIPSGVKIIDTWAFYGCSSLKSVKIPSSVKSIGYEAFHGCKALKSVKISKGVKEIGDGAFNNCTSLDIGMEVIPAGGFQRYIYSDLKSVKIRSSVKSIGKRAFHQCSSLKSVKISKGVKSIGDEAFSECTRLKSVNIPSSVKSIGSGAFYGCKSLKSVNIPSSVKSIGSGAFWDCKSLKSISIPSSVKSIGSRAFDGTNPTFYVVKGSYAHSYAVKYGISYKFVHTTKFNANGGKAENNTKLVKIGSSMGALPSASRKGYKFLGWYTQKSGGSKISSKTKETGSKTYYAHWRVKNYTVKLNVNGGKKLKASQEKKTVTYGKKYGKLAAPKFSGYKFSGWYTAKSGGAKITATSKVKITKTTTLYARWKKK
jgi:uncharacterized repeat protein (TIGR02543 family)